MNDPIRVPRCFNYFFIVLFCMISSSASAGPGKLDSVLAALKEYPINDTTRVNMHIAAANLYRYEGIDSAQANGIRGLALAEKIHFEKGEAECLKIIGITWLFKAQYDKATSYLKRALAIFEKRKDYGGISSTFHLMGVNYSHQERYDTANECYNNAVIFGNKK